MSHDLIIQCFKDEFDRFHGLLEKQIELCPPELWAKKAGGYFFWQQIYHTISCIELFALPEDDCERPSKFCPEVAMFITEPEKAISKEEMLELAAEMKILAHTFINSLSVNSLTLPHQNMSTVLGKKLSIQNALIASIRHASYHLGCCDAILREHGIKGVY